MQRLARDGYSVEAAIQKGRELPDWYLEEPPSGPGDEFYFKAFWELDTCRPVAPHGLSRIPWSSIHEYGLWHCPDRDMVLAFVDVIREMDNAFLGWRRDQADRDKPTGTGLGGRTIGKVTKTSKS